MGCWHSTSTTSPRRDDSVASPLQRAQKTTSTNSNRNDDADVMLVFDARDCKQVEVQSKKYEEKRHLREIEEKREREEALRRKNEENKAREEAQKEDWDAFDKEMVAERQRIRAESQRAASVGGASSPDLRDTSGDVLVLSN